MTATLRVVLDQLVSPTSRDLAEASRESARALIATAPRGADVAGIVPRGEGPDVDGLADLTRLGLGRRELAAAWQLGIPPGVGRGMIHSPTLLAPLVRHDRLHETHQIVVTLWDLRAWEAPESLTRAEGMWQRAMLSRAEKHADAVVVPTHVMADALAERLPRLAGRIRVIAGAAREGFRVPTDSVGRLRSLSLPPAFVALAGSASESDGLGSGFRAVANAGGDADVVILDCPEGGEPAVMEQARAAGLPESRVHVRCSLEPFDRAAVLGSASAFLATSTRSDWPARVMEALAVGVPIVAADSPTNREVLSDAAAIAPPRSLADALDAATQDDRYRVLARDRAKGFSWSEHAGSVWQLHAEL